MPTCCYSTHGEGRAAYVVEGVIQAEEAAARTARLW